MVFGIGLRSNLPAVRWNLHSVGDLTLKSLRTDWVYEVEGWIQQRDYDPSHAQRLESGREVVMM